MRRWSSIPLLLMLVILLLAAAVRFHHLDAQSFWYDEGVAFGHSQRTLAELIPALQNNVHVPAYFGLLAFYEDFVGSSEFALRSLSVLWSVLSVALTFALGKKLFSPVAGLSAAGFVAMNTFSIYYAQETRMYAMMSAVAAASMWVYVVFLMKIATSDRNTLLKYGGIFSVVNIVGMYTHFSYALVMLTQAVMALLYVVFVHAKTHDNRPAQIVRALVIYAIPNLITTLFFLPWLGTALSQTGAQPNISDVVPLDMMLRILQGWFAFGNTFEATMGNMALVMYFLLLFGLLILPDSKPSAWWRLLLPVVWVLLASGIYLYLGLYTRYLRFLLPVQLAFALWMGRGVWLLWRVKTRDRTAPLKYLPKFAAVVAAVFFMVTQSEGLALLYGDVDYQRDDYRGLAATIDNESSDNDAIILSAPGLQEIFGYYYDGDLPVYPLPVSDDTRADTAKIISEHDRIFAVLYGTAEQDADGLVEGTLNSDAYQISDVWVGDVRLLRYVSPAEFDEFEISGVKFGENIVLEQFAFLPENAVPGDVIQLQHQWSTDEPLETRYKVFVQLLDSNGFLVTQRDSEPAGG
ncbi:MAG: glycosyltransferase family 39 protein, partial [Aggregatilineales bacterium]